jgi:streptogramin lyase
LLEIDPETAVDIRSIKKTGMDKFGKINDLLEDTEGNVWILSYSGLYRTTGTRLKYLKEGLDGPFENIHAVRYDLQNPGKLWFSNDNGLFLLNLSDGSTRRYMEGFRMPNLKINCLYQDKPGYIWAGTFNYGVFRVNPADGTWIRITEEQGLVNNNVLSISGHEDTLWLATLGGASEIILQGHMAEGPFNITTHNHDNGLVSNFIYSVYEDTHDKIWFATDGDGISVLTKNGWISYNEENGLGDDVIYSVTGDKYENIWIASASSGIYKFDGDKFSQYGIKDGLSSLEITGIATSADEVIVIHNDGLNILHIPTGRIAHYGDEVGLAGISPDLNVTCYDPAGNVWIGTRTGIIRYQPGSVAQSYGPQTVLEELSIYLEPRGMKKNLVLGYKDNHVSFKYAGLWFSSPEKVSYQVMLEGYDIGWKDTYDRSATYSSLPPGKYTFRVHSSQDQAFRNASEASYAFTIKGPFWLSAWFIILVFAAIGAGIYFIMHYREDRMRRIEQEKKEKVEFEFQVLKNQVNPHFLFNSFSTLISLIEEQPEQAVKYTEKLSDFFRTILQYKDQEVITLKEELFLIESYFFLLKKRFGDNLNLEINLEKDNKEMFIPPMTLQILIENAVKHNIISKDKPLFIRIYEGQGRIIVENNLQMKKIAEVSTGIGLENIRKRYRLITKEEAVIEETEDVFRVKLPMIKSL